jgi:methylisocitrate lyase
MQHRSGLYRLLRYADYNDFDTETYNFTLEETNHGRADH